MLVCGNYLAFYRTDEITDCIDRIIYGKRDYMAILYNTDQPTTRGGAINV